MRKYILGIILALLLGLGGIFNANTMALDSDYKNNLLKVDINKAQDGSYNIELFTQKPYNEPVKVIKKSDTSYYVLLPETYHSITSVPSNGDVSKVDVKLFPYAGQDLNNGYTKINISTNKPVTFKTNVKTASVQKPQVDSKKLAQLDKAFDNKTNAPAKVAIAQNQVQKPVIGVKPVDTTKPAEPAKAEKPSQTPVKIAVNPKPVVKTKTESAAGTEIEIVTKPKQAQVPKQQEILTPAKEENAPSVSLEEVLEGDLPDEDELAMEEDAKEQGLTEIATGEDEPIPEYSIKREIKDKIRAAIKACVDNPLLVIAIILFLIAIFLLLSKGKKSDKEKEAAKSIQPASPVYNSLDNIKPQDAAPQHIAEDNSINIGKEEYSVYESGHIETPDAAHAVEASAPVSVADAYEPKPMQTFEDTTVAVAENEDAAQNDDEADVLASESFGENRGLCLVNYDGDIALIGYIEDEIFVIQNFGKVTLINPGIQIRVAEQNDNDTIYIVKTANSKLMVRETKTFIGLEMVM